MQLNKAPIRRRRIRGAAGSIVEIPQAVGLTGIQREQSISTSPNHSQTSSPIHCPGTMVVSETDLHQIFAEAILAGRPGSGSDAELITGIAKLSSTDARQVPWAGDPRFSHFVRNDDAAKLRYTAKTDTASVQTQLKACKDLEEMTSVVTGKSALSVSACGPGRS